MSVQRKFAHRIRLDKKADRTPQGFLRVPAYLTRTGVLKYVTAKGQVIRELRHPDDVFNVDSYKMLCGAPLTNNHPDKDKDGGMVTPENAKKLVVGWLGDEVGPKDIFLQGMVTVADDDAIGDVESGKVELSCGYTAELIEEQGIYNGEPYDVRQTNIQYNHVSLVKRGRAGENVRLLLDSDDVEFEGGYEPMEESRMNKFKIGDKEYEVSPELHGALQDAFGKHDATVKEMQDKMAVMVPKDQGDKGDKDNQKIVADADKKVAAAEAKADALQAEIDSLKSKRLDSSDADFQKAVTVRSGIESVAKKAIKEPKFDGKSNLELMKEVLTARQPKQDFSGKSETYIQVRFDMECEVIEKESTSVEALRAKHATRADGAGGAVETPNPEDARKKSWEADSKAWQRK